MIPETGGLTLNLKLYFIVGGWMTAEKTNPFLKECIIMRSFCLC